MLNELFVLLKDSVEEEEPDAARVEPIYRDFQAGDVRHSLADISKTRELLGYELAHSVRDGLAGTLAWYRGGPVGLSLHLGWAPRREEGREPMAGEERGSTLCYSSPSSLSIDSRPRSCPQAWSPVSEYLAVEVTSSRYVSLGGFRIDSFLSISNS